MIQYFYKTANSKTYHSRETFRKGSWIHVENATKADIGFLSDEFDLSFDILNDALDIYEVPRLEVEDKKIYIIVSFPTIIANRVALFPLLIVLDKNFVMTLSVEEVPFIERIINSPDKNHTKESLILQVLEQVNNDFNSHVIRISRKVRSLINKLDRINNRDIIQIVSYETSLNEFVSDLLHINTVISKLFSGRIVKFNEEAKDELEDIKITNLQLIELSKSSLKTMVNTREASSTIMTNNLNRVIKLFTSLTVLLTIPTIISSIYGMNVHLPFENNPLAFVGIVAVICLILGSLSYLFYRREWL